MDTPTLFLSHNKSDKRFVRRLAHNLELHGVKVWVDEAEIRVGDSLIQRISDGLLGAQFLGVVLSQNSVTSSWVQRELEIATTREISGHRVCVLPILYKDCDIPIFLQGKLYADFRNKRMFQPSLLKILDSVLPKGFTEHILLAVRNAMAAEYWTYKQLPDVNITKLIECFTDGSARTRIIHLIKRHAERGWIINNPGNPSAYEILELKLREVKANRAIVLTEEYWYLRWYDTVHSEYRFIYNHKNFQTYALARDEHGKWLVDTNIYQGPEYLGTNEPV